MKEGKGDPSDSPRDNKDLDAAWLNAEEYDSGPQPPPYSFLRSQPRYFQAQSHRTVQKRMDIKAPKSRTKCYVVMYFLIFVYDPQT
jgi:hypothetical protein